MSVCLPFTEGRMERVGKRGMIQHRGMCPVCCTVPDSSGIHVSVYWNDRGNWCRIFSRLCMADSVQYVWCTVHCGGIIRNAGGSSTSYRSQRIWCCLYDHLQQGDRQACSHAVCKKRGQSLKNLYMSKMTGKICFFLTWIYTIDKIFANVD